VCSSDLTEENELNEGAFARDNIHLNKEGIDRMKLYFKGATAALLKDTGK
jgi:hypothetical protein